MSIFTKDCPVCAACHPVHVVRCGCGHCFDPHKLDGVTQELEVIAQEERLYRDYLSARAQQADQAWRVAKVAAAMDPGNTVKAAEALLAEQTTLSTRAELDAQDARAHAVSARIKVVRSSRRNRRQPKSTSTPPPAPASVRAALAPPPAPPAKVAPAPVQTPKVQAKPVAEQRSLPAATPQKTAPRPSPAAVAAPAKHDKQPPARVSPAAERPIPTLTEKVNPAPKAAPAPVVTVTAVATAPARKPPAPTTAPVIVRNPTPAFRATQATKAAQVVATPSGPGAQECPNCSAKVPANVKRCRCGFEMPLSASQLPSLNTSPEDRAALLAALAPPGTNKR